ncbi:hypothetical protein [Rhodococcus sp. BP22]|uniref:hypothetical protein n=1 Tax=Rhodococcus sp. BP22 TaxID=2758566 RepID=UPI00164896B3|nr:hypothetical protein [Rhodococcus sp. BP22]
MFPDPLDEFPIHQVPLSMARTETSDRNFYDRYYFNAHDQTGDIFLVSGFGVYPNLGVVDAFATVKRGTDQRAVRFSDALQTRYNCNRVGDYSIEVIEPLQKIRLLCEHPDLSFDLTWEGSFPAILEERHLLMNNLRPNLDASRFAQLGSWSGAITVDGDDYTIDPSIWMGSRDRSWGIRPSGDPDPGGRLAETPAEGFWWVYCPLRFEEFAILFIAQEDANGHRSLNNAIRVYKDGRVEQLGWPRVEIVYAPGSRRMTTARLHMTDPQGKPVLVDLTPKTSITLQIGGGYGSDPEWSHGRWMGADWSLSSRYDTTESALAQRSFTGVNEYVVVADCDGAKGSGMFEHRVAGIHRPSGFDTAITLAK